jgi:predicted nucleic acid-binding protein
LSVQVSSSLPLGAVADEDYIVAATALELEADLVTGNIRQFPMFAGLEPAY